MPGLIARSPVHAGRVIRNEALAARMRRVTVQAEAMIGAELRPAQDVELHLREESGRRVKRRYTIRRARTQVGELDLDVLLHGEHPGSAWGARAAPGDEVSFQGPRGKLVLTDADWHLLCGDESALPAISAIAEALTQPAIALIECGGAEDELPVEADVRWAHRGAHPPGTPDLLLGQLEQWSPPPGAGHAYLLGETRSMVALRAALESRGLAHDAIFVKGYWNIGRPDRIAGRTPTGRPGA